MAGKLFICVVVALAQIQPFYTLPAVDGQRGEYYTSDGIIVSQDPIYWRPKNAKSTNNEHVVIVEPTITYTRHAEYQPATSSNFKSSPNERESDFKPYDGSGRSDGQYYPYYIRAASSDVEDRKRAEERVRVVDVSDPSYQRFVPRSQSEGNYYYESRPPPKETATPSSPISSFRLFWPNGTAVRTYFNQDNQQVVDIHPNQYIIQVAETTTTTTTTPKPTSTDNPIYWRADIDCPPFSPCNTVVYQPASSQCCKCYLIQNRCCPCNYGTTTRKN